MDPISTLECRAMTVSWVEKSSFISLFDKAREKTATVCRDDQSVSSPCRDAASNDIVCINPRDEFSRDAVEQAVKAQGKQFCKKESDSPSLRVSSLSMLPFFRTFGSIVMISENALSNRDTSTADAATREGSVAAWCAGAKEALPMMTVPVGSKLFFPDNDVCSGISSVKFIEGEVKCDYGGNCRDASGNEVKGKKATFGCGVTTID